MAWPTTSDLEAQLTAAGVILPLSALCVSALAEAIERWEQATGYVPFAASATATQMPYDLTDRGRGVRLVNLGAGIPTGTTVVATLDDSALTAGDGEDYELLPLDAVRKGRPYNYLKLSSHSTGRLKVTARWGFCVEDEIPEIAAQAVLAYAALSIAEPALAKASSGDGSVAEGRNVQSADEGDAKLEFASTMTERKAHLDSWKAQWETGVRMMKRQTL